MKRNLVLLLSLIVVSMTTVTSEAGDEYYYYDAAGYCTFEHHPTYNVYHTWSKRDGGIYKVETYTRTEDLSAAATPTSSSTPAPDRAPIRNLTIATATPTPRQIVQGPVLVSVGPTTVDMAKAESDRNAAAIRAQRDAEQHFENLKAAKQFKNGASRTAQSRSHSPTNLKDSTRLQAASQARICPWLILRAVG